jgi:hypothetical protein
MQLIIMGQRRHDQYQAQLRPLHILPTSLPEFFPPIIRNPWGFKAGLLIFEFQFHTTPTKQAVIGRELSITCQLRNNTSNLEAKAPEVHGIYRLISKVAPRLPPALLVNPSLH